MTTYQRLLGVPFTWESQACQFARVDTNRPGISLDRNYIGEFPDLTEIECLLYRSKSGVLQGILYYYSKIGSGYLLEKQGNANLFVDPACQRQGIGTALLRHAMSLWDIDFEQQRYSDAGFALMQHIKGLR